MRTMDLTMSDPEHSQPCADPRVEAAQVPNVLTQKFIYAIPCWGVQIRYKKTVEFKKFDYLWT